MIGGGRIFRRTTPGKPIDVRSLNPPSTEAERQSRRRPGPGVAAIEAAGIPLERVLRDVPIDVRITGGGPNGVYSWQGIYMDPANPGAWLDLPTRVSGTLAVDPLYEMNRFDAVPADSRVVARREPTTGARVFQADTCSSS